MKELRQAYPGMTDQCARKIRYGGVVAMPETDQCFKMMPQQRWTGVWAVGFEFSRFCPAPASSCSYDAPGAAIWLTTRGTISVVRNDRIGQIGPLRFFSVDFIGRKTSQPGAYGHMGGSSQEIVVDRVISVSEIKEQSKRR